MSTQKHVWLQGISPGKVGAPALELDLPSDDCPDLSRAISSPVKEGPPDIADLASRGKEQWDSTGRGLPAGPRGGAPGYILHSTAVSCES